MIKSPELLAPVGKIESFYAAVENGADAIYVGGKQFSARQFADNLEHEQLKEIAQYAHVRNIKVYVTVNTLIKNEELDELALYIHYLCQIGIDGVIVQDFGVARMIRKYFPSISLHASTQMTAHSKEDVQFLKECGYERVVLARELTIKEIQEIKNEIPVEIETFVHGALCVCYSGQCLMSSMIGGRSGNRGRCAQPCRLPYTLKKDGVELPSNDAPYLMSPKDVQTLDILPRLVEVGIDSLKIEGRMKTPEYVASVVGIYRKYIDKVKNNNGYNVEADDRNELLAVFNRGGFTEGYFTQKPGNAMMATISPKNSGLYIGNVTSYNRIGKATIQTTIDLNPGDGIEIWTKDKKHVGTGIAEHIVAGDTFTVTLKGNIAKGDEVYLSKAHRLLTGLQQSYQNNNRKSFVTAHVKANIGQPIQLVLTHEKGAQVSVAGAEVSSAKNAPITKEQLYKQIAKFGNTPFQLEKLTIECDPDIYIPISKLNELRRAASELLIEKIVSANVYDDNGYKRYIEDTTTQSLSSEVQLLSATVQNIEQLQACIPEVHRIYWELKNQTVADIQKASILCHENNRELYVALPSIERNDEYKMYQAVMEELEKTDIDGYLIRTYGQYGMLQNSSKKKIIDYTLNIMNNQSILHWQSFGVDGITLSVEMSANEVQKSTGQCLEMVVYGHMPMMITEQCVLGRQGVCQKNNTTCDAQYELVDRKNEHYPIVTDCKMCRMQVLSSKPIILANKMKRIQRLPVQYLRFLFTVESKEKVREILSSYAKEVVSDEMEYTNRYFTKGVE